MFLFSSMAFEKVHHWNLNSKQQSDYGILFFSFFDQQSWCKFLTKTKEKIIKYKKKGHNYIVLIWVIFNSFHFPSFECNEQKNKFLNRKLKLVNKLGTQKKKHIKCEKRKNPNYIAKGDNPKPRFFLPKVYNYKNNTKQTKTKKGKASVP